MKDGSFNRINNAQKVYIIVDWFGKNKITECYKDEYGVFRPYASGGARTFQEHEIKFMANSIGELKEMAPEHFI